MTLALSASCSGRSFGATRSHRVSFVAVRAHPTMTLLTLLGTWQDMGTKHPQPKGLSLNVGSRVGKT
eukprot:1322828-Amphidinium_carterae.1